MNPLGKILLCVAEKKKKEHRATRWMKRMKRIISFLLREQATVFIEGFSCFGKKQICMDGEQMGELALII